jgi:hypothetical protein
MARVEPLWPNEHAIQLGSQLGHMENITLLRALGCEQQAREASDSAIRREWEALAIEWHQLANTIAKTINEVSQKKMA